MEGGGKSTKPKVGYCKGLIKLVTLARLLKEEKEISPLSGMEKGASIQILPTLKGNTVS